MAMISAIFIDHLLSQGDKVGLTTVGLVGFIPAIVAYTYLMLSHNALEAWSWKSVERSYCFDLLFRVGPGPDAKAVDTPSKAARPTLGTIGSVAPLLASQRSVKVPAGTASDYL